MTTVCYWLLDANLSDNRLKSNFRDTVVDFSHSFIVSIRKFGLHI